MMETDAIRKEALQKRRSLSPEERAQKSALICDRLLDKALGFDRILCYYALYDEVDLTALYEKLLSGEKALFFPVTKQSSITFYRCRDLGAFSKGSFSVMEPTGRSESFDMTDENKVLCLTPGVSFDRSGNRIGFGKGCYDRFFAGCKCEIYKTGVTFSCCLRDEIQAQPWDVRMDEVVCE